MEECGADKQLGGLPTIDQSTDNPAIIIETRTRHRYAGLEMEEIGRPQKDSAHRQQLTYWRPIGRFGLAGRRRPILFAGLIILLIGIVVSDVYSRRRVVEVGAYRDWMPEGSDADVAWWVTWINISDGSFTFKFDSRRPHRPQEIAGIKPEFGWHCNLRSINSDHLPEGASRRYPVLRASNDELGFSFFFSMPLYLPSILLLTLLIFWRSIFKRSTS